MRLGYLGKRKPGVHCWTNRTGRNRRPQLCLDAFTQQALTGNPAGLILVLTGLTWLGVVLCQRSIG